MRKLSIKDLKEWLFQLITNLTTKLAKLVTKKGRLIGLVLAIFAAIFLTGIFSGFMLASVRSNSQTTATLSNVGVFKAAGIGVYWDSSLKNKVSTIDWGALEPGAQKSVTVYMRNEGNFPITLSMSTSNWNPSAASSYISLTWDYNGQPINSGAYAQITLTLKVSADATGIDGFSFDIVTVGSE
jgi:hypothetical protein